MLRIAIPVTLSLFLLTGCATSSQEAKVDPSAQKVDALERALARTELRLGELSKELILLREKTDLLARKVADAAVKVDPVSLSPRTPPEGGVVSEEGSAQKKQVKAEPIASDKEVVKVARGAPPVAAVEEMPELKQVVLRPPVEAEVEPLPGQGLFTLAYKEYEEGRYARAILDFEEFVMSYPNHPSADDASFFIGESYFSQGEYRQASIEFQKLLERYPEMGRAPMASLKVAFCFKELGENENYKAQLMRVVERYPDTEASKIAERMLQSP
ncbi:MAG: tol-pal system protein YbgF [Deltaproteobacteria bacterium]|nr:MAG: tol-pal system protein YbgF [Deltaproteobacteria bacterium]